MNVIKIVKTHLESNGFSGLVSVDSGCGCELANLVPCDCDPSTCRPGYKHTDPRSANPDGWAIWTQKEPPAAERWEGVEY